MFRENCDSLLLTVVKEKVLRELEMSSSHSSIFKADEQLILFHVFISIPRKLNEQITKPKLNLNLAGMSRLEVYFSL